MLVSVIVPVYNVELYLDKCIDSICSQTYKDLEIILIDDGSEDSSGIICDQWCENDKRIHVVHQCNSGVSGARNTGLSVCTGDLIGFVDSDDWIEPDMIEKLVNRANETNSCAVMCGFVDYPHGAPVKKGIYDVAPSDYSRCVYQMIRRNGYFTSLWAKLFSRDIVFYDGDYNHFDLSLSFGEDEVWLFQVLKNCQKVAFLPEALYYWRPREGSISRPSAVSDKQLSILEAKRKALSLLPDDEELLRVARGRVYNDCFSLKVLAYCTGDKESFKLIDNELNPMWRDWLCSREIVLLRKMKVVIINLEMLFHMPSSIIKKTNSMTHR